MWAALVSFNLRSYIVCFCSKKKDKNGKYHAIYTITWKENYHCEHVLISFKTQKQGCTILTRKEQINKDYSEIESDLSLKFKTLVKPRYIKNYTLISVR